MKKSKLTQRVLSFILCLAMLMSYIPLSAMAAPPGEDLFITDTGTADSWEAMMGTPEDGNRYAGRVWVDKSVYADGDTAKLSGGNGAGSSFEVELEQDESFQIVFSALGSTMSSKSTVTSSAPMDVVLILDASTSMDDRISGNTTRLQKMIEASNKLLGNLSELSGVRLGIVAYNQNAIQVLPFGTYDNGVELRVRNNKYTFDENNRQDKGGTIQAFDKDGTLLYNNTSGYARGTNTQSGINMGMSMLEKAQNTGGRTPVAIVLTDGAVNTAAQNTFYNIDNQTPRSFLTSSTPPAVVLATLLNASYKKVRVEDVYGKAPVIYGIGVDIAGNAAANAVINPAASPNGFSASNSSRDITEAYELYNEWLTPKTVQRSEGSYRFTFDHGYTGVTLEELKNNINYVDTYFPVTSANLENTFDIIYEELASGVFNPISSTTVTEGATGVEHTPLTYADFIGEHMEIKEIQAITLFGHSYGVIKHADGTYTVEQGSGKNPTTNENWNTNDHIKINVTEENGIQKLEINIYQEILPIIMEHVDSETIGETTTATITEMIQSPLRVYYTVGLSSDILLPSGEVDITKLQGYEYINNDGTVYFYSNQFGEMNAPQGTDPLLKGDAHVGFQPSAQNRFYYHQANQGIFTGITNKKTGEKVTIPANNEYGIVWDDQNYELSWMTYEEYKAAQEGDTVYTYVSYYRPTAETNDAANAAEEITYLVYTDWKYLKESVAFYDNTAEAYLYDGKAIPEGELNAVIGAYLQSNPNAELYAVLGVGSKRTSRLHNMTLQKLPGNLTGTAEESYSPQYIKHNGKDVVVWLGNNGRQTVAIDTGIALKKEVTEPMGNPDDTYELTVTVPSEASPVVKDEQGNTMTYQREGNTIHIRLKANETAYITGIPGNTLCEIGEIIPQNAPYYIASKTDQVLVPTLQEAIQNGNQFVAATVTNAPYKFGDLTIIKDITFDAPNLPAATAAKEFTFKVQLPVALQGKEYAVDAASASLFTEEKIKVGADGSFTVKLKDNESITILNLPENTPYTVTEEAVAGYTNTSGTITGTIEAKGDHDAHFINHYETTPIKPAVTVTGTKTLVDENNTYTADEDFTFVLSQYTAGGYVDLKTATAKAGESYTFSLADVLTDALDMGDHYFRITEQSGTTPGMSYDAGRGLFLVRITDENADGTLEYEVQNVANTAVSGTTVTKDFVNTYEVDRTHADITIQKNITNHTGVEVPLNNFRFELVNTGNPEGASIPNKMVTTDASGKATIRLEHLIPGEYTYTLTEKNDGMAGMDYDDTPRNITVKVEEVAGVLQSTVTIDGTQTGNATFQNVYTLKEAEYTISGTKKLNGRNLGNEFTFELYETDASFEPAGAPKETALGGASFSFPKLTYTKAGTHYYVVKEKAESLPGITYDTTHYHIIVTVSPEGDQLKAVEKINKIGHNDDNSGQIVFVNSYTAKATSHTLSGIKHLLGRAPRDGEFSFTLHDGATLLETVTNKGDGTFTFKPITFTAPDTYTYVIDEVLPDAGNRSPGVDYTGAGEKVIVKITVADENAELKVTNVVYEDENGNPLQEGIEFRNVYDAADASVTFNGTKTMVSTTESADGFTFRFYETDHTFDVANTGVEQGQPQKSVDGKFSFSKTFNEPGTHYFVILEDGTAEPREKVVYDQTQHQFMVQVNDIGDGKLRASITEIATNQTTDPAPAVSAEVHFTNASFDEVTEKEVYHEEDPLTLIDGQKVKAGDILTYHIAYKNYTGKNVVADIMDTIPDHTEYVEGSASHDGEYAGEHVNWILNVPADEEVVVSFKVKVTKADSVVTNTAIVRDGVNTYFTNEVNNHTVEEPVRKDVFSPADETISINGQKVRGGDQLLYKIRYTNTTGTAIQIKITDQIPQYTTYVEGSADQNGTFAENTLTWTMEVPAWETVTVSFKVLVDSTAVDEVVIKNQATVEADNNYTTNEVTVTVEPPAAPLPEGPTPEDPTPEDPKPEDPKPEDPKPEDPKDEEPKPEEPKPEEPKDETPEEPKDETPKDEAPKDEAPEDETPESGNPDTGDETQLQLWFALLLISGGGIITTSLLSKKKAEEE